MARIRINTCGHIDYPCCGCDDVALTGEDAMEAMREDEELLGCPGCGGVDGCWCDCDEEQFEDGTLICPECEGIINADVGPDRCRCNERGEDRRYDYEEETPFGREMADGTEVY